MLNPGFRNLFSEFLLFTPSQFHDARAAPCYLPMPGAAIPLTGQEYPELTITAILGPRRAWAALAAQRRER